MKNIILSDYIKQYAKENGFRFSDFDMASIIYHQGMTLDDRQKLLRKIARKTRDNALKIQISQRIKEDAKAISLFNENDGSFVYVLVSEDSDNYTSLFFDSFKAAFMAAVKRGKAFDIEKYRMLGEEGIKGAFHPVSVISFDSEGNPVGYMSDELEGHEEKVLMTPERFEQRYINMPNPFTTGDIVYSPSEELYGVVITSFSEYSARKETEEKDYEMSLINVDFLIDDGYFENRNVKPIDLEKIFIDNANIPYKRILKMAGQLVKGKCPISEFISTYASEN